MNSDPNSRGAYLICNPEGLTSALDKIKNQNVNTNVNGAVSHLYFTNPFLSKNANSWFATHPSFDERIKRLREIWALLEDVHKNSLTIINKS